MAARMEPSPRAARYSGSDRPAWRMNHTGVRVTGSREAGAHEVRAGICRRAHPIGSMTTAVP